MSKIIFNVLQSNVRGGIEKVFVDYSKILNKSDFKLICLTSSKFPNNNIIEQENIERIDFDISGHFDILAAFKLFKLTRKHKPSLIIAHNGRAFAAINLMKKLFRDKTKVIGVSHGGSVKRILGFDGVICVASHIEKKLKNFKGLKAVIHNGVEVVKFKKKKRQDKDFNFGIMSRLSVEKNIELAINAFAKFNEENKNSNLIIAGDGDEKDKLEKLCVELGVKKNVKFLGWIKNKETFFNQTDVFLLPSKKESFGISILDAFNYECPVIASDIEGPKEIILENKTGCLFKSNDEKSLLKSMKKVFNEQGGLREITKAAKKDLKDKYSFETMGESLLRFIELV